MSGLIFRLGECWRPLSHRSTYPNIARRWKEWGSPCLHGLLWIPLSPAEFETASIAQNAAVQFILMAPSKYPPKELIHLSVTPARRFSSLITCWKSNHSDDPYRTFIFWSISKTPDFKSSSLPSKGSASHFCLNQMCKDITSACPLPQPVDRGKKGKGNLNHLYIKITAFLLPLMPKVFSILF